MLKLPEIGQVGIYSLVALAFFYGLYSAQSFILSNIFIIGPGSLLAVAAAFVVYYVYARRSQEPERRRVR
jgi:hypothetical protein